MRSKYDELLVEMHTYLKKCHGPSREERYVLAHHPLPGETRPRPCTAPGCTYAHNPDTADEEFSLLLKTEAAFASDKSKAGKSRYSKWRMTHAACHQNIQPGVYGKPMLEHHLKRQILDALHYSELGLPKTPWKHGLLNNCSDDARSQIEDKLSEWKHPLDTRRKDDNRDRRQKWFNGERWATFMHGRRAWQPGRTNSNGNADLDHGPRHAGKRDRGQRFGAFS